MVNWKARFTKGYAFLQKITIKKKLIKSEGHQNSEAFILKNVGAVLAANRQLRSGASMINFRLCRRWFDVRRVLNVKLRATADFRQIVDIQNFNFAVGHFDDALGFHFFQNLIGGLPRYGDHQGELLLL